MTDVLVIADLSPEEPPSPREGADGAGGRDAVVVAPRRWRRWRRFLRNRTVQVVLVLCTVAGLILGRSVSLALTAPGTDSVSARLAIWARDHHAGAVVNLAERLAYKPPKVGGVPAEGIATAQAATRDAQAPPLPTPAVPALEVRGHPVPANSEPAAPRPQPAPPTPPPPPRNLPAPDPIAPIAGTPLPDEGVWQVLQSAGGIPLVRAAYLRADAVYTSYLSAVAWMDTKMLGFNLQPGTSDPGGGPWPAGASLPVDQRGDVVAAFNSAFRMVDSRGGFYLGGKTVGTMREGAATIVFYNDGSVQIGEWGRQVKMTPDVLGARQNLDLIVDEGQVNGRINDNSGNRWGATIGNELYVWRSGVGVTAGGALIYASGPRLSAETLAQLLVRAGAVRAMELDINPSWTIFVHYAATPDGSVPNKLLAGMQRPATLYDTPNSRDFIVARLR